MKPDSMLVEPELIVGARTEVGQQGSGPALAALRQAEPALGAFVEEALAAVAGRLSLSGAPTPLVRCLHEEMLALVLTSVQAVRRGHYQLWKGTALGTRLEELAPDLKPKRNRRPRPESEGEGGS